MNDFLKKPKKILIIDLLYLGDLIFALPFIKNVRLNYPKAQIDFVVNKNFADIIKYNKYLDNIFSYDKNYSLLESLSFVKDLNKNEYDLGLNIHGNWRSLLLMKLIKINNRVSYGEGFKKLLSDFNVKEDKESHMVNQYLSFLKKINLEIKNKEMPEIKADNKNIKFINQFLEKKGFNRNEYLIGINPGGSWKTKRWGTLKFAKLADSLQSQNDIQVVLTGGPQDISLANSIIKEMNNSVIVSTGKTSLDDLIALTKECDLFISGDTGPLHVAAATGTQTISIFGPSDEKKYAPLGENHEIVKNSNINCRPCSEHNCPYGHHKCMKDIKYIEVFKKAIKMIG